MIGVWRVQVAVVFVASVLASCSDDAASKPPGDSGLDAGADHDAGAPESKALIASADGDDAAPGTVEQPTTLTAALERVAPGGTVFLRGGTYEYSAQLTIAADNHGSADGLKKLSQYQREAPILEFSQQPYGAADNPSGLQLDGSYWHLVGLIVRGAAGAGVYVSGSHNVIERCVTFQNRGTGLQLGPDPTSSEAEPPSDNLILDCESFDNYDSPPGAAGNADGYAARSVGPGNVFRGCVSHHNIGDGWELDSEAPITIDQSVAHTNCSLSGGTHNAQRDCSGFELGGDRAAHVVTRSVAYFNDRNGFSWNGNAGAVRLINTLAFDNSQGNYEFGSVSAPTEAVFTNNVSVWLQSAVAIDDAVFGEDVGGSNRFWSAGGSGVVVADFANMLHNVRLTRTSVGDVDLSAFALAPASLLIDSGAFPSGPLPFEASYYHGAPDLGAVETP